MSLSTLQDIFPEKSPPTPPFWSTNSRGAPIRALDSSTTGGSGGSKGEEVCTGGGREALAGIMAPAAPPVVVVPRLGAAVGEEGEGPTTGGMSGKGGGQRIAHGGRDEK